MNQPEIPLQPDLFTGELNDTRTTKQKEQEAKALKRAKKEAELPPSLFTGQETIQFGVTKATPAQAFAPTSELIFHLLPDTRSDEEKAAEAQRQAEALTQPMFAQKPENEAIDVDEEWVIYEYAQVLRLPFSVV